MSTHASRSSVMLAAIVVGVAAYINVHAALAAGVSLGEENASMYWSDVQDGQSLGATLSTGDYNGDGLPDIAVGAPDTSVTGAGEGQVYITYGDGSLPSTGSITDQADVTISGGVNHEHISEASNSAVSSLVTCDLNGDAYDDLIIPAENAVYVMYGSSTLSESIIPADMVRMTAGGSGEDPSGIACGDVNADGYDDLAIGNADADTVHVILGSSTELSDGTIGLHSSALITSELGGHFGARAVVIADINGDGYADIIANDIDNDSDGTNTGAIYIFYGGATLSSGMSSTVGVEITGSSIGSAFGTYVAAGDINNDGMAEIIVQSPLSDDSLLIIPGSSTILTSGSYTDLLTFAITGITYDNVFVGDVDGDGINDLLVGGNPNGSSANDTLYVILGQDGILPNAVLSESLYAGYMLDDSQGDSGFAEYSGMTADMNGDGRKEAYVGASKLSDSSVSDTDGRVYGLFLSVDEDMDGLLASNSLLAGEVDANDDDYDNDAVSSESDCNDNDSTVSSDQTYYADTDSDGKGDPEVATTLCSATAPSGYVANNSDVAGEFDIREVNPMDTDAYTSLVSSVEGIDAGQITVHFTDSTSATYALFDTPNADTVPKVSSYNGTGYLVVLHPNGKKVKLVNVYTGEIVSEVKIASTKYTNRSLKLFDLRNDGSVEVIAAMKTGKTEAKGRVVVVRVDLDSLTLTKAGADKFEQSDVRVKHTDYDGDSLFLNNADAQLIFEYRLNSDYALNLQ